MLTVRASKPASDEDSRTWARRSGRPHVGDLAARYNVLRDIGYRFEPGDV